MVMKIATEYPAIKALNTVQANWRYIRSQLQWLQRQF